MIKNIKNLLWIWYVFFYNSNLISNFQRLTITTMQQQKKYKNLYHLFRTLKIYLYANNLVVSMTCI